MLFLTFQNWSSLQLEGQEEKAIKLSQLKGVAEVG